MDRPSPKSVAFQIPSDSANRNSMCQSPTWEAYGRRKQEKKEEELEKKERERQEKEALKSKRARLSKQPPSKPPVTVMRQPGRNQSDTVVGSRQPVRERPSSVMGLVSTSAVEPPTFHQRHRSGSFSSLMKAFDLRKTPSEDLSNGFIGGIKLEQERFDATYVPDDPEKTPPPVDVHPAFRNSVGCPSSSSLSSSSEQQKPMSPSHARKRSYPPIAMQTTSKQTRSLLSPDAAASSDLSTIDKWRARVGLKRSQKQQTLVDREVIVPVEEQLAGFLEKPSRPIKPMISGPILNKAPANVNVDELPRMVPPSPDSLVPVRPKSPVADKQVLRPQSMIPHSTITVQPASPTGPTEFRQPQFFPQKQPSDGTESILSVPPPPPRRSSKRRSWIAPDSARFLVPKLNLQQQQQQQQQQQAEIPSSTGSTATLAGSPAPSHLNSNNNNSSSKHQHQLSSSDDSGSDYSHSPWAPSTPATSRPQSDTDLTPVLADIERFFLLDGESNLDLHEQAANASLNQKTSVLDVRGPAQMAANKLLASIPNIPVRQASIERRGQNTTVDIGFVPQVRHHDYDQVPPPKSEARNARSFALSTRKPVPAPLNPSKSTSTTTATEETLPLPKQRGVQLMDDAPIAKVFVECCSCKYYHDMPSRQYEAMSNPEKVLTAQDKLGFAGALSMTVGCPWCKHEMSTRCCAGLAAIVYVKERLH